MNFLWWTKIPFFLSGSTSFALERFFLMRIRLDSLFEEISAKTSNEKQTNIVMIQIRNIIISLIIPDRKFYGFFRLLFPLLHDLE
ncbi:hypothetical protein B0191_11020 [Leptospira interrogans serovar Hardjo]|nr:hypothetical protein B0191_11020 [Leptospira interrogans serovar Hardjo]